jgi:glutamate synthase (ferredoxin)
MLMPGQVEQYFPDLRPSGHGTALALVHSRFSTNTFPSWERAHPYRYLAHNGEINTCAATSTGCTRGRRCSRALFGDDIKKILPIINPNGSDSAMFDNCLELLVLSGRSLPHAMMMMIPEPWVGHESMSDERKAFYEYHSCLMEAWDGPGIGGLHRRHADRRVPGPERAAAVAVLRHPRRPGGDGVGGGGAGHCAGAGEAEGPAAAGQDVPGRYRAGADHWRRGDQGFDLRAQPYREWINRYMVDLAALPPAPVVAVPDHDTMLQRQQAFGYTFEDLRVLMVPMARDGVEAVGSMGTDTPLAVLSEKPQLLYNYFKQLFAQVTNPPVDCIREEIIFSTETTVGAERNLLTPEPRSCQLIELKTPILTNEEFAKLKYLNHPAFTSQTLPILFRASEGAVGLEKALDDLFEAANKAIEDGYNVLILSDRG